MFGLTQRSDLTGINIVVAVLGLVLFLSPWLVGFREVQAATWNTWICGLVIAGLAVLAVTELQEWQEWVNAAFGLWTAAAPWILGFAGSVTAMWTHVVVGLVVAVLAAVEVWLIHNSPPTKAA